MHSSRSVSFHKQTKQRTGTAPRETKPKEQSMNCTSDSVQYVMSQQLYNAFNQSPDVTVVDDNYYKSYPVASLISTFQ